MNKASVNPARQQGASLWGVMILVGLIGLVLTMALKIAPTYMTNNIIANAINGIIANNDIKTMPITEIRNDLMRTVRTNRIEGFNPADVKVVRENDIEYIDIKYERRVHLMYNIDAVVMFNNRFNKF
jgi:hypothetical protein